MEGPDGESAAWYWAETHSPAAVLKDEDGAEGERRDHEHGDHGRADEASLPRRQRPPALCQGDKDLRRKGHGQREDQPDRERVRLRRAQVAVHGGREQRSQVAQAEEDSAGQRRGDGQRRERRQAAGREDEEHEQRGGESDVPTAREGEEEGEDQHDERCGPQPADPWWSRLAEAITRKTGIAITIRPASTFQ